MLFIIISISDSLAFQLLLGREGGVKNSSWVLAGSGASPTSAEGIATEFELCNLSLIFSGYAKEKAGAISAPDAPPLPCVSASGAALGWFWAHQNWLLQVTPHPSQNFFKTWSLVQPPAQTLLGSVGPVSSVK